MKKIFTIALFLMALPALARNNALWVKNPLYGNNGQQTPANLKDVSLEVTPKGIYAQVDLIFTIVDTYGNGADGESILFFDLPAGSFIQESWLWLNDTTIINADIVERELAVRTYTGIVRRQQDPSLLLKNGTGQYRLNVYPIRTNYARKVKMSYCTPFVWHNGKASVTLPTSLLGTSETAPAFTLRVNTNTTLTAPSFLNLPFSNYVVGQTPTAYTLNMVPAAYRNSSSVVSDLHLAYNSNLGTNALVYTFPTAPNEGVYQFVIPAATPAHTAPKNVLFVIDQFGTPNGPNGQQSPMVYPVSEVVRFIKNTLVRDFNATDSFNVVYANGNAIVKASPGWRAADLWGINSVIDAISVGGTTQGSQVRNLLRTALPIAQAKPGAQTVLIGCDQFYSSANRADTMFTNLKTFLGGFTNRVDVINNSAFRDSGVYFYNKLCGATGGKLFKNVGKVYDIYTNNAAFDLDMDGHMRQIYANTAQAAAVYNLQLPVNGVGYSQYEPTQLKGYNPHLSLAQVGRYFGSWPASGNIQVKYVDSNGLQTSAIPVVGTNPGSSNTYKSWLYNYMSQLSALNGNGIYTTALVDSSVKNRILHDYTAFLALETGDTIRGNGGGEGPIIASAGTLPLQDEGIHLAPNPFTDAITISCEGEIEYLQITDLTGRLIWQVKSLSSKEVVWRGTDAGGAAMPAGIYIVSIIDKAGQRHTAKVEKR